MIAGFLTELDLRHVTVVCNDWGGAQLVISPGGTDRVANLVLVSCEAFDNYPPGLPGLPGRLLCRNAALLGGRKAPASRRRSPRRRNFLISVRRCRRLSSMSWRGAELHAHGKLGGCEQVSHAAITRHLDQLRVFGAGDVEIDLKGVVGTRGGGGSCCWGGGHAVVLLRYSQGYSDLRH